MVRAALLLALVTACATGESGAGGGADARPVADAAEGRPDAFRPPDADLRGCLTQVPADWGSPTPVTDDQSQGTGNYTYYADLVSTPFQRLFVALHPETGVFSGAVQPGNFVIEGDETDYQWCGACVYLAVDDGDTPSTIYMAESGKIDIDSVGADGIHGQLSTVTLREIAISYEGKACGDPDQEWPCGNTACSGGSCGIQVEGSGCRTYLESLRF